MRKPGTIPALRISMANASGYVSCDCRDCFEIAISGESEVTLCNDCEDAGCDGDSECSATHAYCGGGEGTTVDGVEYCNDCGQAY